MSTKLKATIAKLTRYMEEGLFITEDMSIILAAARAYACEECGGSGVVRCAVSDTRGDCRECKADREVADAD